MTSGLRSFLSTLFVASMVLSASRAGAEPPAPAVEPAPRESAVQLHLDAAAGISTSGALVSALGLVRFGLVEVGGSYTSSGLLSTRTGGGLAAGAGGHRPGGGGWDVLLELGMNEQHLSGGILTSDPGASGAIPYGGLRAGIDWSLGSPAAVAHATLGLWLFARADLAARNAAYAYPDRDWLSGGGNGGSLRGSAMLGGSGEIGITLAGGLDLLP
jgi:hypothetical protein